jgi:hypothetical protein
MRAVALLFVIINLAYLAWATLIDVHDDAPRVAVTTASADIPRLVLASERKDPATKDSASARTRQNTKAAIPAPVADGLRGANQEPTHQTLPSNEADLAANGARCISIGPFQDLASAAQASATLRSAGRDSRQRLEQGQLWVGYWVSVPGFAKREDAERAVARLRQNGMNDVYISLTNADTETSNVISLGVFKESERAQRMLTEAKALGFAAQISDRTRSGSVYWLDIDLPQSESTFDFSSLASQPGRILRLEQRACPAAG